MKILMKKKKKKKKKKKEKLKNLVKYKNKVFILKF